MGNQLLDPDPTRQPLDSKIGREICSASRTSIGGRKRNEDRCYCNDDLALYLVVDGMGGHAGGALASQIAVETVPNTLIPILEKESCCEDLLSVATQNAVCRASHDMSNTSMTYPEYQKMGCTIVLAIIRNQKLYFASVGDCRAYHFRNRFAVQLTQDETLVAELLSARILSHAELEKHPWKHVVTNSVSARGLKKIPDLHAIDLAKSDRILLTSDGLTDEITEREIELVMQCSESPKECVDRLIDLAEERNARDNVSCIVIDV